MLCIAYGWGQVDGYVLNPVQMYVSFRILKSNDLVMTCNTLFMLNG